MKKLVRGIYRFIKASLITIGLVVTLGFAGLVYLVVQISETGPTPAKSPTLAAEDSVVLRMKLDGAIAHREPRFEDVVLNRLLDETAPIYLPQLRSTLGRAARDPRVKGVFVEIGGLRGDMASFFELRTALAEVRDAEKPIHVYFADGETSTYYLASVADRITVSPVGSITVPGPVLSLVYLGDLLKNIGVDFEVVRAGSYKSAFEPLVANEPSPETLEDYGALEAALRDHMIRTIASGRERRRGEVRGWLEQSFFDTNMAVKRGLVDEAGYQRDAWSAFMDTVDRPARSMKFNRYAAATKNFDQDRLAKGPGGIALIEAVGEIASSGREADGVLAPALLQSRLRWARKNDEVKAVVLRVDSPGGSAVASDVMWREVKALADAKPVVVSMGSVAASGGYYISAPATHIVASPTTITGSIGVIAGVPSFEAFSSKYGVNFHVITQSDRTLLLNPGEKASPADRRVLERGIKHVYETFLERVSEGRRLDLADVRKAAEGKVYTGDQALDVGLIDEIGGLAEAFAAAKRLAGLDEQLLYPVLRRQDGRFDFADCLLGRLSLLECMDEFDADSMLRGPHRGSSVLRAIGRGLTGASPLPRDEAAALASLKRTTEMLREESVLTLWPTLGALGSSDATFTAIGGF